jgi:hypothetical protein
MQGEQCVIERRREGRRVHYRAVAGPELVARSLGFEHDDASADLAAIAQLERILRALRWRPVEGAGRRYQRG